MALSKTLEFKGITVQGAYIRVSGLTIHDGNQSMEFWVSAMVAPSSSAFECTQESCAYKLEGGNPIRQAYDHLKTIDKYAGAEDC